MERDPGRDGERERARGAKRGLIGQNRRGGVGNARASAKKRRTWEKAGCASN